MDHATPLGGINVLVVEDEYIIASELVADLRRMGAEPLGPVPDVQGALRFIRDATRVDTAILNVRLRGELSFPVADELLRRGIPFVFVTGSADDVRHYQVPVHQKPVDMNDLASSLRSVVRTSTSHDGVPVFPQG